MISPASRYRTQLLHEYGVHEYGDDLCGSIGKEPIDLVWVTLKH